MLGRVSSSRPFSSNSGRPALVVPFIQRNEARFKSVLVAWDGSKEAARAVHDALPLLRRAASIEVLTIYTEKHRGEDLIPGADLAAHLARHGLQVTARTLDGVEIGVTDALLSHVANSAVDLIVMGGYAHSRLRHLVFGGATSGNPEFDDGAGPDGPLRCIKEAPR